MKIDKDKTKDELKRASNYVLTFLKWLLLSIVIAAVCGGVGCIFHMLIEKATELREEYDFIIYFLPLGGLIIVLAYHLLKQEKIDGTDYVIRSIRKDGAIPFTLAPGIMIGTVLPIFSSALPADRQGEVAHRYVMGLYRCMKELTERFLSEKGIRYDHIIYNAPYGERILLNDRKPSGLRTAIALNPARDSGPEIKVRIDESL